MTKNAGTSGFKAGTWYVLTTRSCRSWAGRVRVIAMPEDEESWEVDTLMECITEVSWIWTFWWSFFKCCSLLSCIFWSCYCFLKLFIGEHPFCDNEMISNNLLESWNLVTCVAEVPQAESREIRWKRWRLPASATFCATALLLMIGWTFQRRQTKQTQGLWMWAKA